MLNIWGDGATWIAGVEWIPFVSGFNLISFLDRIYRINGIFFACGEIP